jgi:hypothetical protein
MQKKKLLMTFSTTYVATKNHISDQSSRIKTTQENRGNKSSHTYRPVKYTTRTAAPAKKKHTHTQSSNTQHTGSDCAEKQIPQHQKQDRAHCLNSPQRDSETCQHITNL